MNTRRVVAFETVSIYDNVVGSKAAELKRKKEDQVLVPGWKQADAPLAS